MTKENVHIKERGDESQEHLDNNRSKFESDALFLLHQMQHGEVLTAKTVVQKYGVADRRLRDLANENKCSKRWKLNEQGKRLYVEYFVPFATPPSKREVIIKANKTIESLKKVATQTGKQLIQEPLF